MGDATATAMTSAADCGCCRPDPKTTEQLIRELEIRRESLDARLARVGTR